MLPSVCVKIQKESFLHGRHGSSKSYAAVDHVTVEEQYARYHLTVERIVFNVMEMFEIKLEVDYTGGIR